MYEHNLFAVAAREIRCLHRADARVEPGVAILSRGALRVSRPAVVLRGFYGKLRGHLLSLAGAISGKA